MARRRGIRFTGKFYMLLALVFIAVTVVLVLLFWAAMYCVYKGMNDPFMYFSF